MLLSNFVLCEPRIDAAYNEMMVYTADYAAACNAIWPKTIPIALYGVKISYKRFLKGICRNGGCGCRRVRCSGFGRCWLIIMGKFGMPLNRPVRWGLANLPSDATWICWKRFIWCVSFSPGMPT